MLFINYSSAFNNTVLSKLITLGLNTSLCKWILGILTGRPQVVRVGNNTSSMLTFNTGGCGVCLGPPQGCVLSPLQ